MLGARSEAGGRSAGARKVVAGALGLALTAVVAAALTASPAVADRSTWHGDPEGDASPAFTDIRALRHGHGRRGVLRHVIAVEEGDEASRALAQLEVATRRWHYLINTLGVTRTRRGEAEEEGRGSARGESGTAASRRVRIARRGNRVIFAFHRRTIGNPYRYRWAATVGSNDTSPLQFDRAPDGGTLLHVLLNPRRFRGYRAGGDGRPDRVATQGAPHRFVFVDRARRRTRYTLILDGPGDARKRYRGRTNRRGRDAIEDSLYVNDVGGPGRWRAIWRVAGKRVARFRFRLRPEFDR